mgnify:FL=1
MGLTDGASMIESSKNRVKLAVLMGLCLLMALFGAISGFSSANGAASSNASFSASDMRGVVNQYCLACHNDTLATADLSLQTLDFANPAQHAETLEKVVKKLRAHMMPPSNMPRPPFETYGLMTNWLETELDRAWATNPNPGRVTLCTG